MPKLKDPTYVPSKSKQFIDLTGARFGRWTVIERVAHAKETRWRCRCECGNEKEVAATSLRRGLSTSCGCISKTHGYFGKRLYRIWANMLNRCRNPNVAAFKDYGARGVKVCDEWHRFEAFRDWSLSHGYTDSLTIERRDVNGDYKPANCEWVPIKFQAANRRTVARAPDGTPWYQVAAGNGIASRRFNSRVSRGWSHERAATTPLLR
jgi:hypothetical protein